MDARISSILVVGVASACAALVGEYGQAASPGELQAKAIQDFDRESPGTVPAGWRVEATNPREAMATWAVEADPSAPSAPNVLTLKHSGSSGSTFNLCWTDRLSFQDGTLSLRFKANSGEEDQGGGPMWRVRDKDNYYVCRANPLEDNFRLYFVRNGSRRQIASARVKVESGVWHEIVVHQAGNQIECSLDGQRLLEATDDTFPEAGGVGFWTKADAATSFDDLGTPTGPEAGSPTGGNADLDALAIASKMGTNATLAADGVVRVGWARDDVAVVVDGMPFEPAAGLGSWAAFQATPDGTMVMGDTVVFQDEVGPAMDAAFAHGLQVTALHNHFFFDEPKVYFMHIGGRGSVGDLAAGVRSIWDAIKQVRAIHPQPANRFGGPIPRPGTLDPSPLERILGLQAARKPGGVLKFSLGREGKMGDTTIAGSMGLGSWAALSGSDSLAAIDGDFILTAEEVQPVLRSLRSHGLHIVALHNHMVGGEPFFYFTHYWGTGPSAELVRAFKAALDVQAGM